MPAPPRLATAPSADHIAATIPDPVERVRVITELANTYRTLPKDLALLRSQTIAELREAKWTTTALAKTFGLSQSRVSQIIRLSAASLAGAR